MSDEYTPTTDQMRAIYGRTPIGALWKSTEEAFDRWLESEREAVRQEVRECIAQDIEAKTADEVRYTLGGNSGPTEAQQRRADLVGWFGTTVARIARGG